MAKREAVSKKKRFNGDLELLNKKRRQLKKLVEWEEKIEEFENEQVDIIDDLLSKIGTKFSKYGREECKRYIKKYGFEEVYESTKTSIERYYINGDEESILKTVKYIFRICVNRDLQRKNPMLEKANYLVYIAKINFGEIDGKSLKYFLLEYIDEEDFEEIKKLIYNCDTYREFLMELKMYLRG